MEIIGFNSTEEMVEFLNKAAEDAERRLHPAQRAVTYGDYWVRFLPQREVEFGVVHTLEQIEHAARENGSPDDEVAEVLRETEQYQNEEHKVFGRAHIHWQPDGELGYTHRLNLWPISEPVFLAAGEVGFNIWLMAPSAKLALEEAYVSYRAHMIEATKR